MLMLKDNDLQLRNEGKSGVSATTLLTGMNVVVDPLTHRVISKSEFVYIAYQINGQKTEKNDQLPIPRGYSILRFSIINRSDSEGDEEEEEKKKLMRYRVDEKAIYEPEGFVYIFGHLITARYSKASFLNPLQNITVRIGQFVYR